MPEDGLLASVSNLPSCSVVQMLEYDERCAYVRETSTCSRMGNFGNYIEILYCQLKPHNDTEQILCSFLLMTICILIYIVLGCTVENIFCPALKVVSKMLGLNEHLAGVTLLAFGNGSPDLIGTFSNLDGAGPMFPDLFGAGVYVVLLVAGLIFVFYPFEIQWHNVLRDACFLSFGIIYVDYCCVSDGVVTRTESVLIMSVYILYLMVIFIELFLLKQTVKLLQSKLKDRKYATGIPLYCYTLLITVPITIYMLYTTRTDIPPNYHHITALYGVISSVLIIYYSASESVEILRVIGIVTNRSNSFLGCTLQAWGNSIGDLVSTIALARHGYPKMGYAACFGGPFFNSISSFGGVFIYETFRSETPIFVPQGSLGENCVVFQFIATMSVLIWATLTNFSARRSIGIFNFILYAIFLVFVFLGELEIIETFAPENEEEIIDE
ncbi:PREDICTED: sodium/potassium/calcium exchanger 6, mitochondrial isoform X9 [Bactrocera latifrons]|uniref:sodium/potassium/calcium exchanger 6, mitochondrial isoform X9 n=1 Tax=Bactrocera latifrons TaxID=174628 RepID=UPI0008DE1D94|nr:PREDICTED: sodium/potassium/calcium exchanger 6, mitochondrial isoform X9 [Bactrocera latifrons]